MDFLAAVKVVLRRWYIVMPVLALAAVVTLNVVRNVPPTFQASGSVLLASPGVARDPSAPALNPFANLDYSSGVVAGIVAELMQDKAVKKRLVAVGADPNYTLGTPTGSNAPTIGIESTAATPDLAVNTVNLVIKGVQDELTVRQRDAGGPPETWIRALILISPTEADRLVSGKVRASAALAALSVVAAISLAFLAESIGVGRRRRAAERAVAEPERAAPADPADTTPDGPPVAQVMSDDDADLETGARKPVRR